MNSDKPIQLLKKLAKIMGEVESVEKRGYNEFHRYDYAMEADFLFAVRTKLAAANIFITTSFNKILSEEFIPTKSGQAKLIHVQFEHVIYDADSGEYLAIASIGAGIDSQDKAVYKACTGAMKYFISKNFLIPTGDDPEADHSDQAPPAKKSVSSIPSTDAGDTKSARSAEASEQVKKVKPEKKAESKAAAKKVHTETYSKFLDQCKAEKKRFIESLGEAEGTQLYYAVLKEFNIDHANEVAEADALVQYAIFFWLKSAVPDSMYPDASKKLEEYMDKIVQRDRELEANSK